MLPGVGIPGFYERRLSSERDNMNAAMKKAALKVAAIPTLALVTAGHAMAQETATDLGVQAIQDLSGKASTYIAAAFTVAVVVAGGFWGIRMMKKAFGAAK